MFTHQQNITFPESIAKTDFATICIAAQNQDKKTLQQMVDDGVCLSMFVADPHLKNILLKNTKLEKKSAHIDINPIIYLALKNEHGAVKFLIDNFNECLNLAVYGSALDANEELVNHYLALGAIDYYALVPYILAGHDHLANKIMILNPKLKETAITIYALLGCKKEVDIYLGQLKKEYEKDSEERLMSINEKVLLHSVMGGHDDTHKFKNIQNLYNLIRHYAKVGNQTKVDEILNGAKDEGEKIKENLTIYADMGYVLGDDQILQNLDKKIPKIGEILGYALLGDPNYKKYIELERHEDYFLPIVKNLITGNHHFEVLKMLESIKAKSLRSQRMYEIITYYCQLDNIIHINNLIQLSEKQFEEDVYKYAITRIGKNYPIPSNNHLLLRLLSLTENQTLRILFAAKAEKNKIIDPEASNDLIKQAAKINKIMKKYKLNFNKALTLCADPKMEDSKNQVINYSILTWILQGAQLIGGTITTDVFFYITSYLSGLSIKETKNIFSIFKPSKMKVYHNIFIDEIVENKKQIKECK